MTASKNPTGAAREGPPDPRRVSLLWAVQGHVAAISRLHGQLFVDRWDEAAIASLLLHPGSIALIATEGHPMEIGGFVLAQVAADEAEILSLGITEGWRRRGIGARLVEGIKRAAARAGAGALFLEVAESNTAALGLYARAGFVETGRRKGYYARLSATPEDAVVMRCALPRGG